MRVTKRKCEIEPEFDVALRISNAVAGRETLPWLCYN